MSKQLGINKPMDALARENGLGHWSCTDPLAARTWLRSDGAIRTPLSDDDYEKDSGTMGMVFRRLLLCDKTNPIGKDWQQPDISNWQQPSDSYQVGFDTASGDDRSVIFELSKPIRTEEINSVTLEYDLFGGVDIKIEDFVYVHINYDHRYTHNSARKSLAESIAGLITGKPKQPSLVQKPFKFSNKKGLFFHNKKQVILKKHESCGLLTATEIFSNLVMVDKWDFHGHSVEKPYSDLIMMVWE